MSRPSERMAFRQKQMQQAGEGAEAWLEEDEWPSAKLMSNWLPVNQRFQYIKKQIYGDHIKNFLLRKQLTLVTKATNFLHLIKSVLASFSLTFVRITQ